MSASEPSAGQTPRVIGGVAGFCLVTGSMLGIGIFLSPPLVAASVGSPHAFFFVVEDVTNSVTRTIAKPVATAGDYTFYMRVSGCSGIETTGFYRPRMTSFFVPN